MSEDVKEQTEEMLTEEQYEKEKAAYLAGVAKEEEKEESEDEATSEATESSETSASDEPDGEGPAIKENKRLRQLNRELSESMEDLSRKVDELSKRSDEKAEKPDKLKTASLDELIDAEEQIEEKMFEAHSSGDTELLSRLRVAKKAIRKEIVERPKQSFTEEGKKEKAASQFKSLVSLVEGSYPELGDKSSGLFKKAEKYYKDNSELMDQLGDIGKYFAVLASLADKPAKGKAEKQEKKDLIKEMETIVESTTTRSGGTTATPKDNKALRVSEIPDDKFDEIWNKVKLGEMSLDQLRK